MKKVQEVEVEYVKKTTTLVLAVFCLVVGFIIGLVYSGMNQPKIRKAEVNQSQQPASPAAKPDQSHTHTPVVPNKNSEIAQLKQILGADPQNAAAWAKLGHMYFDTNRFDEAIDAYRKHLEINPKNADVWTDMGVMYRRSKQPGQAIQCFNKAIEADPKHKTSRFNKGIVLLFDLNKTQEAVAMWQEILDFDPSAKAPDGRPLSQLIEQYKTR